MVLAFAEEVDVVAKIAHVLVIPCPLVLRVTLRAALSLLLTQSSGDSLSDRSSVAIAPIPAQPFTDLDDHIS